MHLGKFLKNCWKSYKNYEEILEKLRDFPEILRNFKKIIARKVWPYLSKFWIF